MAGGLAVGVPGELAGLWEAHQRFGKVQWSELVRPAKDLALNGFSVSPVLARTLDESRERIKADPGLRYGQRHFLFHSTFYTGEKYPADRH